MRKRVLAILLTLCMLLALMPAGVLATEKVYAKIGEATTLTAADGAAAFYVAPTEDGVYRVHVQGEDITIASEPGIVDFNMHDQAQALGALKAGTEYYFHLNNIKADSVEVSVDRVTENLWELDVFLAPGVNVNRIPLAGEKELGGMINWGQWACSVPEGIGTFEAAVTSGNDCIQLEKQNGRYTVTGLQLGTATIQAVVTLGDMTKTKEYPVKIVAADDPCLAGHDFSGEIETVVPSSATEHGVGQLTCTVCGETQTISLCNTVEEVVKAPTQTEHGVSKYTCTVCGVSHTDDAVHNWEDQMVQPTKNAHGSIKSICTVCKEATPEAVLHNWTSEGVKKSTETEHGLVKHVCTVCKETTEEETHNMVEEVLKEPTETAHGQIKLTCTVCKESHTIETCNIVYKTVKAPSDTAHGLEQGTCTVCGEEYKWDIHSWKTTVKKPSTTTEHGIVEISCKVPGCEVEPWEEELPLNSFKDITLNTNTDWYYAPVLWAVENEITEGMNSGDTFVPEGLCTRAQVVTFLWRAAGRPEPESTKNPFVDVKDTKDTNWYYKAVLWAVENGITTGADATHFNPNAVCDRAMVATFIWRANGEPAPVSAKSTFSDVTDPKAYYYSAVLWATENGIINGMGDGTYAPLAKCQRSHVVAMLYRDAMR